MPHAVALNSCTAAMETAFAYLDLPAGARVGVPTGTFAASALAPARLGALPVLLVLSGHAALRRAQTAATTGRGVALTT